MMGYSPRIKNMGFGNEFMLTVEQLSFGFPGRTIFSRASFCLPPGSITCLIGGNGAGKTTLFNLITGFLRPSAGSIRLNNKELTGHAAYRISRAGVARTFQDLRLIGKLSVCENILLALPNHPGEGLRRALAPPGFHRRLDAGFRLKAESLLAGFFLEAVARQPASEISYGQQKLLTLACCAAMDADLLLDEPVAGISPEYRELLAGRLAALKAASKTILLIEHQPDFLEKTGDAFLFLEQGQIQAFASLAELRAAPMARDTLV
jgi:ABC-type branched-subunit amino acid transport system ATPase component